MTRKEVLQAAEKCVTGQRAEDYGEAENNFATIASLWNTYLGFQAIDVVDVPVMMTLLKIARLSNNPAYPDNWVDACGYMACGGELATNKEEQKE